jgi:hypothetical protein
MGSYWRIASFRVLPTTVDTTILSNSLVSFVLEVKDVTILKASKILF